jgi:hypothetical protein
MYHFSLLVLKQFWMKKFKYMKIYLPKQIVLEGLEWNEMNIWHLQYAYSFV